MIEDTFNIYKPPRDVKELVKLGESPITAIMPLPGCDVDELDRVITQGLLSEVIVKGSGGYQLLRPLTKPKFIGNSVGQIRESLSKEYDDIVHINREFAAELAKKGNDLIRCVYEYLHNSANSDALITELGEKPFRRTIEIGEALMPYVSRLPCQGKKIS